MTTKSPVIKAKKRINKVEKMLDIFDEISQQESVSEKENFSIVEETPNDPGINHDFLIFEENNEEQLHFGRKSSEVQNGIVISRKGSGVSAQMLKTPISLIYKTNQGFSENRRSQKSNCEIGAALTPNLIFQKNKRRATRASESDILGIERKNSKKSGFDEESRDNGDIKTQDFLVDSRDEGNNGRKGGEKKLVTEDSYTEKFDYKKFINEELSKLGNICGWIFLFAF